MQELYGVPQPNIPTAVAQALPVATATVVVPTAYAVPIESAQSFQLGEEVLCLTQQHMPHVDHTLAD